LYVFDQLSVNRKGLRDLLEKKFSQYNRREFIDDDPISIPHQFNKKQDIEISGFWSAILAWGQRKTIIRKCRELFSLMDNAPCDFILNHRETDLRRFLRFKHRTFNTIDLLYFIAYFRKYYQENESLEDAFCIGMEKDDTTIEQGLVNFHNQFFILPEYPSRTKKHIPTPERNSACKRINMFLRWMVRNDDRGVDFGIWRKLKPHQLVCPCDLHVDRVARKLGLITRKQTDWKTALELTQNLKALDAHDPVKYDFALFGMGIEERYWINPAS